MFELLKTTSNFSDFEPFFIFIKILIAVSVIQIALFVILKRYSFKQIVLFSSLFIFFLILMRGFIISANKANEEDFVAMLNYSLYFGDFLIFVLCYVAIVLGEILMIFFAKKFTSKQQIAILLGFNLTIMWIWFIVAFIYHYNLPTYTVTEATTTGTETIIGTPYTVKAMDKMISEFVFEFGILLFLSSALYVFYKKANKEYLWKS